MDTGSFLTWIQCQPCRTKCLEQDGSIFNPSASTSYKLLTCEYDDECPEKGTVSCNYRRDVFEYKIVYEDGSFSKGDYVNETMHFYDSGSVPSLTMGCGQYQNGSYGYAGGITLSTLEYNVQAPLNSITIPFTIGHGGIYYIKVTGFIVGNQILNIPPEDFSTIPYKNGEVVVDSGTVMTWLPPQAYEVLQDAFRKEADNLDLQRVYGSFEGRV
uniref:protein ASPARTIC PROTEASE IN GUARD CELL 1-like n=1 Tax=Erigeron canadensis TaxID=72917 RepID=UPI001CB8C5BA|nr:protein ASPARTIC PROTEASE IN GUARD CELL 1-like [Erigeron canadensis]